MSEYRFASEFFLFSILAGGTLGLGLMFFYTQK